MIKILIVEDEVKISRLIELNLTQAGYACTCAYDGETAADILENSRFDLILLDVMLPGVNGFELMDYIRPLSIPVIFLTAMSSVENRVHGLRLGADDYLTKPFEIVELLARVESVLRRYHKNDAEIVAGDLKIDTLSRVVLKNGVQVNLTVKEYELLLFFIRNKNIALFRDQIYSNVWGDDYMGDSRTVDLHVQRLRKKLGWEEKIASVYKVGYRLNL
ncbi:MAG: response regulator transcription factor [Clostridiales bacterium]|nr:response regulator transcription factor [Clostridiales bacterium]